IPAPRQSPMTSIAVGETTCGYGGRSRGPGEHPSRSAVLRPLAFLAHPAHGWQGARVSMQDHIRPDPLASESFPTDPAGLPEAGRPPLLELAPGDTLELQVGPVAKRLGDTTVRMLGYNGSIPGPTLKVAQGSEIIVHVTNNGDLDTTVHWHGLRLE